jgi:hypothetical protein
MALCACGSLGVLDWGFECAGTAGCGELAGARTQDQRLKRAMLYQLSYELDQRPLHSKYHRVRVVKAARVYRHPPISDADHPSDEALSPGTPGRGDSAKWMGRKEQCQKRTGRRPKRDNPLSTKGPRTQVTGEQKVVMKSVAYRTK